jgi:hypothetical protein
MNIHSQSKRQNEKPSQFRDGFYILDSNQFYSDFAGLIVGALYLIDIFQEALNQRLQDNLFGARLCHSELTGALELEAGILAGGADFKFKLVINVSVHNFYLFPFLCVFIISQSLRFVNTFF